jgi:hypothetical protein
MSNQIVSQIVVSVLLICAPLAAWSGQWSQRCEAAGKAATAACEAQSNAAKAADSAQAAGAQQRLGSGGVVNQGAGALQQQGQQQAQRLTAAKAQCEQEKQKCSSECDKQESERKQKANLPNLQPGNVPPPIKTEAIKDQAPLQEKKQSACVAPISLITGNLGSGASQAAQAAADAGKTGGASNGMMPLPIPIPLPGKDDKKDEGPKTENTAQKLNCDNDGYSKYSDCNNHYIEKCQKAMTSAGCDGFINRYCGSMQTPIPAPSTPGDDSIKLSVQTANQAAMTANLVADKQGEGLGSAFCQKVTAYKYCQMAGRSECPSCKNLNSPWPAESNAGQLADAQKSCPTDPMFLDPAVQAQMKKTADEVPSKDMDQVSTSSINDRFSATPQTAGSAGGGSGGGSLGGAGGAGSVGAQPGQGVSEGYKAQTVSDGFGGGGGGGGGGSDGGGSNYEASPSGPGYSPLSVSGDSNRAPTMVGQANAKDVANQYGPSVFSIQSTTYRDMCARGRLMHCRR